MVKYIERNLGNVIFEAKFSFSVKFIFPKLFEAIHSILVMG